MIHLTQLPGAIQWILTTLLLIAAVTTYIIGLKKPNSTMSPRPISWIGWTLMMGISLFSQIVAKGWEWEQTGLALSVAGCIVVAILSVKRGVFNTGDLICFGLGTVCVFVYIFSRNAWTTTIFAIIADACVAFPTQQNAYDDPSSEKTIAWHFGAAAYLLNSINCVGHDLLYAAFPLYLLAQNASMVFLTTRKVFKIVH